MNRKRAICLYAIIEILVFLILITLFELEKLSLTGFLNTFAFLIFLSTALGFIINRKFPPMNNK